MIRPPINPLHEVGRQAQDMAKNSGNERLAITLQCVAVGSMIVMAATTAARLIKDLLREPHHHGREK